MIEIPTDREAWSLLPEAVRGAGAPLPAWARAVAVHLPRTAAAMLELDHAQRARSPLAPELRAKLRWAAARAHRSSYGAATALEDLRRAAGEEAARRLEAGEADWPEEDREPIELARLLALSAPSIPDSLFASVRARHGDRGVAAIVLLAAYASFQDRILLSLGIPLEAGGPLGPLDIRFAPGALQVGPILPPGPHPPRLLERGESVVPRDPGWSRLSFEDLQARLEAQRRRAPRLPVPSWEDVRGGLPAGYAPHPIRIAWSLTCLGYVPELAVPWVIATRTLWAERPQDRVLEESLFWIQTRAIECSYCMGHCEMLLEVAGLERPDVLERTRRLAEGEWSSFPPREQRAFAYARKLTLEPWNLTGADLEVLEGDYGPRDAMAIYWWLCRGLYMTRVSDGFQLPLERENVFAALAPAPGR